jgi:hypothetical protein
MYLKIYFITISLMPTLIWPMLIDYSNHIPERYTLELHAQYIKGLIGLEATLYPSLINFALANPEHEKTKIVKRLLKALCIQAADCPSYNATIKKQLEYAIEKVSICSTAFSFIFFNQSTPHPDFDSKEWNVRLKILLENH